MMTSTTWGIEYVPSGYSFTPGAANFGTYANAYQDNGGKQLTDNIYNGSASLSQNVNGNGAAYEYVAWYSSRVTIDFAFSSPAAIRDIQVGSLQDIRSSSSLIYFPYIDVYSSADGVNYSLISSVHTGSQTSNAYALLDVPSLNFTSDHVRVVLSTPTGTGSWIFADEVNFYGVPDGGSTICLVGLALLGLGAYRQKKVSR